MVYFADIIGNFGRYHLCACFLIYFNKIGLAYHQMAMTFLAPPVNYQCPGNKTCCANPNYDTSVFARTIIMEWNLICERSWMKEFTHILFEFGVLIGSLACGVAADRFGRKPILIASVLVEIFTGVLLAFLPDFWSFSIVRMILGISLGGLLVTGFVLMMELVGPKYRDPVSALYHVPFTTGHMLLPVHSYYLRDYTDFQLAISVINLVLLLYICFLPESPRWLVAVRRNKQAIKLMQNIAIVNNKPTDDIEQKVLHYQNQHNVSSDTKKGTPVDLFRTPNLRKNIIVMASNCWVCSYCYHGVIEYVSKLTANIFYNVTANGAVALLSVLLSIPAMAYVGRKPLIIVSNVLCGICLLIIALTPRGPASVVLGCFGVFFSFVMFVVVYIYCSELFPTVVRNAAMGISSMMARFGAMIAPFVTDLNRFGKWWGPIAFGIPPLVVASFSILLPETKGCDMMMTLEQGEVFGNISRRADPEVTDKETQKT